MRGGLHTTQAERKEKAAQAKYMVQVVMSQEDVENLKALAGLHQAELGSLAAVYQVALTFVLDQNGRQAAGGGWDRGGGAEEDKLNHGSAGASGFS